MINMKVECRIFLNKKEVLYMKGRDDKTIRIVLIDDHVVVTEGIDRNKKDTKK